MERDIYKEISDYYDPKNIQRLISEMVAVLNIALEDEDYKAALVAADGLHDAVKRLDLVKRLNSPFENQPKQ